MSILSRYISRRITFHFVILLVGMTALSLAFELMEESDQVLHATGGETSGLLRYSLLRLPDIVSQMLPIAALLGELDFSRAAVRTRRSCGTGNPGQAACLGRRRFPAAGIRPRGIGYRLAAQWTGYCPDTGGRCAAGKAREYADFPS